MRLAIRLQLVNGYSVDAWRTAIAHHALIGCRHILTAYHCLHRYQSPVPRLLGPCRVRLPSPYLRRCRRLSSGDAPASQPSCLRLFQTSNCRSGSALRVRPFAAVRKQLLGPRLTAAFPRTLGTRLGGSPGVRRVTFLPPTRIYSLPSGWLSGFRGLCLLAHLRLPSYAVRVPRAGSPPTAAFPLHPCPAVAVRLGVPTTRVSGGISTPLVTSRSAFASRLSDVLTDVGAPCPAHTVPDEKRVGSRDDHRIDKRGDARFDVLVALDM